MIVAPSPTQHVMPLEGIDWRTPARLWRPLLTGRIARTCIKSG
jgi:hypothetical protein